MALRFPSPYILPFSWATISHLLLFPNVHRVLHSHLTHSQKQGTPTNCPAPTLCPPHVHASLHVPTGDGPSRRAPATLVCSRTSLWQLCPHSCIIKAAFSVRCDRTLMHASVLQQSNNLEEKNHFDSTSCLLHLLPRVLTTCITKILSDLPYLRFQFFSSHFSPEPAPIMLLTFTLLGH